MEKRDQRESVRHRLRHDEPAERKKQDAGRDHHSDDRFHRIASPGPPRSSQRAEREEEHRCGHDQVALGQQAELAGGEHPHLEHEPEDERDRNRKIGASSAVGLAQPQGAPEKHEQRARRQHAREQRRVTGVVGDEARGRADGDIDPPAWL